MGCPKPSTASLPLLCLFAWSDSRIRRPLLSRVGPVLTDLLPCCVSGDCSLIQVETDHLTVFAWRRAPHESLRLPFATAQVSFPGLSCQTWTAVSGLTPLLLRRTGTDPIGTVGVRKADPSCSRTTSAGYHRQADRPFCEFPYHSEAQAGPISLARRQTRS